MPKSKATRRIPLLRFIFTLLHWPELAKVHGVSLSALPYRIAFQQSNCCAWNGTVLHEGASREGMKASTKHLCIITFLEEPLDKNLDGSAKYATLASKVCRTHQQTLPNPSAKFAAR